MSAGALVGAGAVVAGALVWAAGSAGLACTSAVQDFPRDRRGRWARYAVTYAATLVLVVSGVIVLGEQVGAWALLAVVVVFVSQWALTVAARRQALRRARLTRRR